MHNRMIKLLTLAVLTAIITSCTGALFTKVQVKATPTVNAALGSKEYLISDYFTVADVTEQLGSTGDMTVNEYTDSTNTQKFLVHMPIMSVPLEFGDYMETNLVQPIDPISINVPAVAFSQNTSINFDINATILSTVNAGLQPVTTQFFETGSPTAVSATIPNAVISITDFDTATFSGGAITLAFSIAAPTPGLALSVANIELRGAGNVLLTSSASPIDIVAGGTANLPLTGVTLQTNMTVVMTGTTNGGTALQSRDITIVPSLSADASISDATGVDFAMNIPITPVTAPLSSDLSFQNAVVGDGDITISLGALPGLTNTTRSTDLTFTQALGFNYTRNNAAGDTIVIPFVSPNQYINNAPLTVAGNCRITAVNATLSGLSGPVSITVGIVTNIRLLDSVTIVADSSLTTPKSYSKAMTADMLKWVNYIDFSSLGLELALTNPLSNTLDIMIASTAFGIPATTRSYGNGLTINSFSTTNPLPYRFTMIDHPDFDFTVTITPPGYDGTYMTLTNITPGENLSFSGNVAVVNTWSAASLKLNQAIAGSFPAGPDPIDLSELATLLGDNLGFSEIPVYFYLTGLSTIAMDGRISAAYTKANVPTTDYFLGTAATTDPINVVPLDSRFPIAPDTIFDGTLAFPTPSIPEFDLVDVLNAKPADLRLEYNLVATDTVITPADLAGTSLNAELYMILPLALKRIDSLQPAEIVIDQVSKTGDDLFGRETGDDTTDINRAFDSMSAMTLSLAITNNSGLAGKAFLRNGPDGDEWTSNKLTLETGPQTQILNLDKAAIQYIKDNQPFAPKFVIEVPSEGVSIARNGNITVGITVSATTDIDQTFDLGGN